MMVPILKQGHVLIATIMAALSDETCQFREALDRVVTSRASAVIIDVMAMDAGFIRDADASRDCLHDETSWAQDCSRGYNPRSP